MSSSDVVALTQGDSVPSTRFRWRQYQKNLTDEGILCSELTARWGAYAPPAKLSRPFWLARSGFDGLSRCLSSRGPRLRFLQRHLIATLFTFEGLLKAPFVFDVDDAIFLGERGRNANEIARRAVLTICGNAYLADHFSSFGQVAVLPTAVDSDRFVPAVAAVAARDGRQRIVWSGTSGGFKYVHAIEAALTEVLRKRPNAILRIVSDRKPSFRTLQAERWEFVQWTADGEVAALQECDIGIMPLSDDAWSRGKCSFKMLTYMSTGLPVVVAPVGMNSEVLAQGQVGLAAQSADEWIDALVHLLDCADQGRAMGSVGRAVIEQHYSVASVGPRLAQLLKERL